METIVNIFEREMTILTNVMLTPEQQNDYNIQTTTIGEFVAPERQYPYKEKVDAIRALCRTLADKVRNKPAVDALKKALPAGIPSGVAVGGIGQDNIETRNGVIQFDIDAAHNPSIYDWEAAKTEISRSPYIGYTGLSVTKLGVWGLIPIADAMKHKEHFDAMVADFANTTFTIQQYNDGEPTVIQGIKLDPATSNIASKRFMSYDPYPYVNTEAKVYTKTIEQPVKLYEKKYAPSCEGTFDVEAFLQKHGIAYRAHERRGGIQYEVTCPWVNLHSCRSRNESAVFVNSEGKPCYHCFHAHCADKHWHDFRAYYDEEYRHRFSISYTW